MSNDASGVLWRRLKYMLSPQLDLYKHIAQRVERLNVLEIGFGTGFGTVQLAAKANFVTATELDISSVVFANSVFPLRNIDWVQHDITEGKAFAGFDAIVCLEVLEHIPAWGAALLGMLNALKKGGTLYISGPNANANLRKNDIHEREWTAKEFYDNLHEVFSDVKLWNYSMTEEQGLDTNLTPLLAICHA